MTRDPLGSHRVARDVAIIGHGADLMDALLTSAVQESIVQSAERALMRAEGDLAAFDRSVEVGPRTDLKWVADFFYSVHTPADRERIVARRDRCIAGLAQAREKLEQVNARQFAPIGELPWYAIPLAAE